MSHVFISYSHKDQEYAVQLAQTLEMEGYHAWIDNRGIDYGAHWPQAIQEALDTCTAFIVVMTQNAYESPWVQNELSRAHRKEKPLFPFLLEGDEPWLMVESTQYVDVRGGKMPPKKFYDRLSKVLPKKQQFNPEDSGYIVFDLDSKIPQHVVAAPPDISRKPRGEIRQTGSHQKVNQAADAGWYTPDSGQKQAPQRQRPPVQGYGHQQQPYENYPQQYTPRRSKSSGFPKWMIFAGLGGIGFIGLIIMLVIIASLVSNPSDNTDDLSQVEAAEGFVRAVITGDYDRARELASSDCSDVYFVIEQFELAQVTASVSGLTCQEHDTDVIFCEYSINGSFTGDTIFMDGNKVCSFATQ